MSVRTISFLFGIVALGTGCHSLKITEPPRSATEQLLLSAADDHALFGADLAPLKGRRIFVEEKYFESYDKGYALGSIRELISRSGGLLVEGRSNAQVIVEVRSAVVGLDNRETLFGIPEITIPIPLAGAGKIPEIALYKSQKADSIAKFALFAYDRETGAYIDSSRTLSGRAQFYHYKLLGVINWRRTDVPELDPKLRKRITGSQ